VKLLLDQNLSSRLVEMLSIDFPQSTHVRFEGLATASDTEIWEYAKTHGYTIVSKDSDFHQRSVAIGAPPKVVWIQRGNCTTDDIAEILRTHVDGIRAFVQSEESAFLELQ